MNDPLRLSTRAVATSGSPASQIRPQASRFGRLSGLARWEVLLAVILLFLIWEGGNISPFFLTGSNFSNLTSAVMEVAIMALPMTLIIVTGEIDLSVESMVGLSGAILGYLWAAGIPIAVAIPICLGVGVLGGLMNGLLVTRGGLPSLVVTLGTLALFRGIANVVLGTRAISNFPPSLVQFGFGNVPGTPIPWTLLVFLALGVVFAVVLHATWIGRHVFAVGKNKDAARYSGVRVRTLKTGLFMVTGLVSALAGIILAARFSSARSDNGTGLTLTVVTIVLLGGVDINGGRGTIPGVILAVFTLAVLQSALRLAGWSSEYQAVAVGLLLIISVGAPYLARQTRFTVGRVRGGRQPPAGSPVPGEVIGQQTAGGETQ